MGDQGLVFDVLRNMKLVSVLIKAKDESTQRIELFDKDGNSLDFVEAEVPKGESRVTALPLATIFSVPQTLTRQHLLRFQITCSTLHPRERISALLEPGEPCA